MMYLYMDIHHIENITVHKIYISYEAHLLQCIALHPKYGKVQTFQCIRLLKLYKWIKLSLNFIVFCYWQYLNKYYLIKLNLSPFFKTKSEFSIMNINLGLFINNSIISSQLWHYWRSYFKGGSPRDARSWLVSATLRSPLESDLDPPLSLSLSLLRSLSSLWCRLLRWLRFSRSLSLSRLLCSWRCFLLFFRLKNKCS